MALVIRNKEGKCFCGELYRNHPRCALCNILVGPQHIVGTLHKLPRYNGVRVCFTCLKWARVNTDKRIQYFLQYKWEQGKGDGLQKEVEGED